MATVTLRKTDSGEGPLTQSTLAALLADVPGEATLMITCSDPDDPRERGVSRWHFTAVWQSATAVRA